MWRLPLLTTLFWWTAAPLYAGDLSEHGLPLRFEANRGQSEPWVGFIARGGGRTVLVGATQASWGAGARLRFVRANPAARIVGLDRLPGLTHYFQRSKKLTGIESYARAQVTGAWPGVTVVYYGSGGRLEYDFIVDPHTDPGAIELEFERVSSLRIDAAGDLVVGTRQGPIRHRKPRAYQSTGGSRREVACRYVLSGRRKVRFSLGPYEANAPLVIDPLLDYSSYVGGSGDDRAYGVAVDAAGCTYLVGETSSVNFPRVGTARAPAGYTDVFVLKLSSSGGTLLYSGYLGGLRRDSGRAIAVDSAGNAHIAGFTYSSDFPVTAGAAQRSAPGIPAAFAAKLDASGSNLLYSTYLGGSGENYASGIAVDATGKAYVTGYTSSAAFPTTAGALRRTFGGGAYDAFIVKLDPLAPGFAYSTYLGGAGNDIGLGVAVDAAGSAYVAGQTSSSDFPVQGAYQTSKNGDTDAFLAKLNPAGSALVYSSFLGGSGTDLATAIAVDAAGSAYVAGGTVSEDFPTSASALQKTNAGSYDAVVTKFAADGSLAYSTLLGGSGPDQAAGIAIDSAGNAYITGLTASANLSRPAGEGSYRGGYDAFIAGVGAQGAKLLFFVYAGGSGFDQGLGIAATPAGTVFATGHTFSSDFSPLPGGWQATYGGGGDAFLLRSPGRGPVLLFQNDSTWEVQAWRMGGSQGATTLTSALLSNAVPSCQLVASADLDGNGDPDLLWQNAATRRIGASYMGGPQGETVLSMVELNGGYPITPGWNLVGVADLNRDGFQDLFWYNPVIQKIGVWYMGGPHGETTLSMVQLNGGYPIAPGWKLIGVADLNGDGVPDLLWHNSIIQKIGVWYMGGPQGATALAMVQLNAGNPVAPGWNLVGAVDLNGDGVPDLLWHNPTAQKIGVWYMGGSQGATALAMVQLNGGNPIAPGWRLVAGTRR